MAWGNEFAILIFRRYCFAPTYFFNHAKYSLNHSREFCGFKIQWFSSGKNTSLAGTLSDFSVE